MSKFRPDCAQSVDKLCDLQGEAYKKYLNRTMDEDLYDDTSQEVSEGQGHGVDHGVVENSPEPA